MEPLLNFDIQRVLRDLRAGVPAHDLESETLEFKEEEDDLKKTLSIVADAVVCFANARGGTIVVGIRNRAAPGASSLVGVSAKLTVDVLRRAVFELTEPGLSVSVTEIEVDGAGLLALTVPEGAVFYSNARGTATRRVGSDCLPFPPEQQLQAAAARGQIDWSAASAGVGLEAVSVPEAQRVRRLLGLAGRQELAAADDAKLFRDLRLVATDGSLTRAGLLMVGDEEAIAEAIPSYGYSYQYRSTPGAEATYRARGRRSLLAAVELLLEAVAVRTRVHPITTPGGVQVQIQDYPFEAVRELVVNALIHRDFERVGSVDVEHSPDWLTVTSPGGLVFGVTPDNILTHPSTPRHRLLLETVTALQVAERTGQGIDRTYRELLRSGKPPPSVSDDGLQVRVLVPGGTGNDSFARFVADTEESVAGDVDALLAMSALREKRHMDASDLSTLAQRSLSEAQNVLERLAAAGLLQPTRRTARKQFPNYVLTGHALASMGRAVSYHHRQSDDVDRKVREHVREYGHITNQTLRRLFNMDIGIARNSLRDLQQRDILRKLDPGRGGRGIRYGPGPRFDADRSKRAEKHADGQVASVEAESGRLWSTLDGDDSR